jgi:hypothetical protein
MTIFNRIIRLVVALIFSASLVICVFSIWDAHVWSRKIDLITPIAGSISIVFAWLLWTIK